MLHSQDQVPLKQLTHQVSDLSNTFGKKWNRHFEASPVRGPTLYKKTPREHLKNMKRTVAGGSHWDHFGLCAPASATWAAKSSTMDFSLPGSFRLLEGSRFGEVNITGAIRIQGSSHRGDGNFSFTVPWKLSRDDLPWIPIKVALPRYWRICALIATPAFYWSNAIFVPWLYPSRPPHQSFHPTKLHWNHSILCP